MRKPYSPAQQNEAVTLAAVVGAEAAAKQLGMRARTIRGWSVRAGKAPADAIGSADWRSLGDLARAKVAADLAAGRVRPKDAAVIAAIAQRNVRDVPLDVEPEHTPEQLDYAHRLEAALATKYGIDLADERASDLLDDLIADLLRWSITEANAGRHGMTDDEAPEALVARLPDDWEAYRSQRREQVLAERQAATDRGLRARDAWPQYHAGRITAEERDAWIAGGPSPIVALEAAETAALVAAAEAYLRRTA